MGEFVMHNPAERLWDNDIDQIEKHYMGGLSVTSLPIRRPDGRVPNQGSVVKRYVDIDQVVAKPSWFAVTLSNCKWAITGRPK